MSAVVPQASSLAKYYRPIKSSKLRSSIKLDALLEGEPTSTHINKKLENLRLRRRPRPHGRTAIANSVKSGGVAHATPSPPDAAAIRNDPGPDSKAMASQQPMDELQKAATEHAKLLPVLHCPTFENPEFSSDLKAHALTLAEARRRFASGPNYQRYIHKKIYNLKREAHERKVLLEARASGTPLKRTCWPTLFKHQALRHTFLDMKFIGKIAMAHAQKKQKLFEKMQLKMRASKKASVTSVGKENVPEVPTTPATQSAAGVQKPPSHVVLERQAVKEISEDHQERQILSRYKYCCFRNMSLDVVS
ncbi:hypothetical protein HDZ31DRAFT_64894 [Schizophyllum fasciatum]